ncbi:hypothetical protein L2Y94_03310 [Luteibacter aegosomatis]|uniref:enterotoxin A family protein n=1 Tax=Luteibacter aegosomatis TaxID=2911537 RepID=UPI001FF8396C|nr:enterotoxin A family protein [Luteibacter aegosomatis]UPG86402.1 hypothetical protein L2Y94_03310 [Luteibacter aegosomatis]
MRRAIALTLLVFVSTASHATFFYRMDTRPPEEVFQHGFAPSGNDSSLFQHVVGQTCQPGSQTSGFVAVSANETFAVNWGRETQPVGTRFYVYRIRASEFFYNAAQSLFHASRQTDDSVYELAGWVFMTESEWVTPIGIPAEDIVGAAEYVSRGRNEPPGRVGVFIPAGARDTPGSINHAPFTWNYSLDATRAPPAFNPLCPSVCFGTGSRRTRRSVIEWIDGTEGMDEARVKARHMLECVARTASAVLDLDDPPPEHPATRRPTTEL